MVEAVAMQSLLERLPLVVRQNSLRRLGNAAVVAAFLFRNSVELRNPPRSWIGVRGDPGTTVTQFATAGHPIRMRPRIH